MKKRKILSLLLSLCLLIGLLPTAALAADQTNAEAGIRIQYVDGSYDKTTGIMKVRVQAKMPAGTGITCIGILMSWDNTKLSLVSQYDSAYDYTPADGVSEDPASDAMNTIMATKKKSGPPVPGSYTVTDGKVYTKDARTALYTFHANTDPLTYAPNDAQTSGNWFDVYEVMFRVTGKPADPATVLNSDSLRIADVAKGDDAVMKGAFPANDIYSIYLTDNSDPARLYVLNRMSGCTATEVTGEKSLMTAPETGTATYPGSDNAPSTSTTYTVTVQNDGNGMASASPATAAAGTEITLTATPNSGYVFNEWVEKNPTSLTIGADGKFIMPSENVSVKATFKPAALTGTASITGTLKFNEKLTASLASTNNTGTLTYKWYRSGETAEIATNTTGKYTLVADDIGKTITVKITSNVQTGEITSAATATVVKADGPAAPSVTSIACTNSSNNDGKITGVNTTMEYSTASDFATKTACTGSEITGLANGTYYVRVAETPTHKAGTAATVIVSTYTPGALGGSASISGTAKYGEVLTAVTSSITGNTGTFSYQWKRSGTDITSATNSTYKLVEDDIGKTITVAITSSVESGTIVSSPTAAVEKADGPAAPSVTSIACTNSSNNDGKITGVNTTMEYSTASDFSTKTACTGSEITGLANGTYYVRVAETTTHKAGAAATVSVPAYTSGTPTEYTITFNVNGGSGTIPSQTTSGQKLSSLPTATHSGSYSFAGWYTAASGGTQITTAYTFSADTTVYAHWTYTGGSVVIIPDTDETDKSEPENPGTGAAVNPGTGAAAAGSSFGYPFVALAAVHAIYAGTKKLAKKDED